MTETTAPLPAGGPPGLPGRIVARIRRDVPLAVLDAFVVVPAYLIPLVFGSTAGAVGELAVLLGAPSR